MIYVSSSCVRHSKIKESVQELVDNGFKNIELSGGTEYYEGFEEDLLELKDRYSLNYLCHNYFPPPKKHLVLNLASLNDDIFSQTFEHFSKSIKLSHKLGASVFGFHAGFFLDIKVSEIGKKLSKSRLFDKSEAIRRFCDGFIKLQEIADKASVKLHVENNVYSFSNSQTYNRENIFMLTDSSDYLELKKLMKFNLLLDVAHLKVSAHTLNLDFETELRFMIKESNYIHISDNDALHDLNNSLATKSNLVELLKSNDLKDKIFTLEIYDGMQSIKNTNEILIGILDD